MPQLKSRDCACAVGYDCLIYCQRSMYDAGADSSGDEAGVLARTGDGTPTTAERASLLQQDVRAESDGEHHRLD